MQNGIDSPGLCDTQAVNLVLFSLNQYLRHDVGSAPVLPGVVTQKTAGDSDNMGGGWETEIRHMGYLKE